MDKVLLVTIDDTEVPFYIGSDEKLIETLVAAGERGKLRLDRSFAVAEDDDSDNDDDSDERITSKVIVRDARENDVVDDDMYQWLLRSESEDINIDLPLKYLVVDITIRSSWSLGGAPICRVKYPCPANRYTGNIDSDLIVKIEHNETCPDEYTAVPEHRVKIILVIDENSPIIIPFKNPNRFDDPREIIRNKMFQIYARINGHLPFVTSGYNSAYRETGGYPDVPENFISQEIADLPIPETFEKCMVFYTDCRMLEESLAIRPCA